MATHDWNNDGKNDMIDNYIGADTSELQYKLDEATLLDVIVASGLDKTTEIMPKGFRKNKKAMALAIENNIASTIINNQNKNLTKFLEIKISMKIIINIDYLGGCNK